MTEIDNEYDPVREEEQRLLRIEHYKLMLELNTKCRCTWCVSWEFAEELIFFLSSKERV
jgi:hypothetical protein